MLHLRLGASVCELNVATSKRCVRVGASVWTRGNKEEPCAAAGEKVGCDDFGVGVLAPMCIDLFCV